jgi:hypothetical protein
MKRRKTMIGAEMMTRAGMTIRTGKMMRIE